MVMVIKVIMPTMEYPEKKPLGAKERHPRSPDDDDDDNVVLCRIRTVFQVPL